MASKNMTIKDIARESGCSVSTVSRALNNHPDVSKQAKEAIARVVEQNSFVLNNTARMLKQQQSRNIIIVVKGTTNLFYTMIVEKMQSLISDRGYHVIVHYLDEDVDGVRVAIQLCRERKPLGLIFLGGSMEHFQKGFAQIEPPAVLVTALNEALEFGNLSSVSIDDVKAGRAAIDYLMSCGHRRIGIIGGNPKLSFISLQRLKGSEMSYEAHGVAFDADWYQKASFRFDSAYRATKKLLARHPDLSALFCMSDVMAIGAMRALADLGLHVPADVSVVGFDGIELGQFYNPRLTSIAQPHVELAEKSVALLVGNIEQQRENRNITLDFKLTAGASVRSLRN